MHAFKILGHRIGLHYAYLIYHLVTPLGASFPDGVSCQTLCPIGYTTILQSRSHVHYSSASVEPVEPIDPSMPTNPIDDILFADSSDILPSHYDIPPSTSDIPSSSTSMPPSAQPAPTTAHIDPSIASMGQCRY